MRGNQDVHKQSMQETEVVRKGNTNLKDSSFMSIAGVLELIDRTLVYGIFLLKVKNEDRIEFSRTQSKVTQKKGWKGGTWERSMNEAHRKR